jgi:hypothetical protein
MDTVDCYLYDENVHAMIGTAACTNGARLTV